MCDGFDLTISIHESLQYGNGFAGIDMNFCAALPMHIKLRTIEQLPKTIDPAERLIRRADGLTYFFMYALTAFAIFR